MTGEELKSRRRKMQLTQQGLADRLYVTRNTVARWEREERSIPAYLTLALRTIEREKPRTKKAGKK